MLISSLLLGFALGYLIKPAQRFFYNYDWYKNYRKYSIKQSLAEAFVDMWN